MSPRNSIKKKEDKKIKIDCFELNNLVILNIYQKETRGNKLYINSFYKKKE